jgi:hypothetical protein
VYQRHRPATDLPAHHLSDHGSVDRADQFTEYSANRHQYLPAGAGL